MIENLNLKLECKEPVTRIELFELVSSWGRKDSFRIDENIKIEKCKFQECYPLENIDVSQIKDFDEIFRESYYNGDLSNWNISNARTLRKMFIHSEFNNDSISNWDVSNVKDMRFLFYETNFNKDISKWDISNCINMLRMFEYSKFDGDISKWQFHKDVSCYEIFYDNYNFEKKYNHGIKLPYCTEDFLKWFEENRTKIASLNISKEEILDIDDYLSNFNEKELTNGN